LTIIKKEQLKNNLTESLKGTDSKERFILSSDITLLHSTFYKCILTLSHVRSIL